MVTASTNLQAAKSAAARPGTMVGDLWGGLAAMLVALPAAVAYGVLVYSAIDPALAGQGALYGILGAAALGIVTPVIGRTPALITAPCAPAAAVLTGLAVELVSDGIDVGRVPALLALTAGLAGALQLLFGLLRGGRFIKYIPYPVVNGYLSGVGLIIASGQLPKLLGVTKGTAFADGIGNPASWHLPSVGVGLITIATMLLAARLTQRIPAAILALIAGIGSYFAFATFDASLLRVDGNAAVIGRITTGSSVMDAAESQFAMLASVSVADLQLIAWSALALAALLAIDTLKTCVVLDALTGNRHDSNRELLGQGAGNMVASAIAGMPGAGTSGPTLVNVASGGISAHSGALEGVFVVAALLLAPLIAWVPIGALAGVLLVVAFRMFDWSSLRLLRNRDTRLDFLVIATVAAVAASVGLIAASASGVGLAILLFIRDQVRGSVLRRRTTLASTSSKKRRLTAATSILAENGDSAVVVDLQGNLFFGTTDQLFTELDADLQSARWMLLDLRRVQSMDYTAVHLLRQMQARLVARDGTLLLCGMPSNLTRRQDIERYLAEVGLTGSGGSLRVFETRDEALEWMEDQILAAAGHVADELRPPLRLQEADLLSAISASEISELERCGHYREVPAGGRVFSRDEGGDEMYVILAGEVAVSLPLPGDKRHHVATFGRGDFFGEMAFVDQGTRSADAVARAPCLLFVLSRREFNSHTTSRSGLGLHVFEQLARAVSMRLRQTNIELRALEER